MSIYAYVPKGKCKSMYINCIPMQIYEFVYAASSIDLFDMSPKDLVRVDKFKHNIFKYVFIRKEATPNNGIVYKLKRSIVDGIYYDSMEFDEYYVVRNVNNTWASV